MPIPKPHQTTGALFLAERKVALLADMPRVGKTGAAIMACDYVFAGKVIVVTKASARANWGRDFREWQMMPRKIQVIYTAKDTVDKTADVVIIGWAMVFQHGLLKQLERQEWDVLILDESHEAKNPESKRTIAVYGTHDRHGLRRSAKRVWLLSGTPIPNAPNDLYAMLKALAPERLGEAKTYDAFMHRYCVVKKKYVGGQWIEYAIKGRNEDELRARLEGFWLRRTQKDVGIGEPLYSFFAVNAGSVPTSVRDNPDLQHILDAIHSGERLSAEDEMHLGTVRRLTGALKALPVIEAVQDLLDEGLDKIVLMAWHTEVIDTLRDGLKQYGVVGIDGRTPPTLRQGQENAFRSDPSKRVFVGQILAAGEAIDLSAACELWFVESSLVPKDMKQASLRITNHTQTRQAVVRVCVLENSIDDALQQILTRKWVSITAIQE